MTILSGARSMRYEVGTNLKGRGIAATWTLLRPSLEPAFVGVVGRASSDDLEALDRVAKSRVTLEGPDALSRQPNPLDLILVGRGGVDGLRRMLEGQPLAESLSPTGSVYGEFRGGAAGLPGGSGRATRRFAIWPAFGAARVFVPSDDRTTIEWLRTLGFLPPRGSSGRMGRALNRLSELAAGPHRSRRWAELALGSAVPSEGPPAYVVEIARRAGVAIETSPWALVAPGDYASQKVLLLLFDPVEHQPWTIVKLGADPAHAGRLRNEASMLAHLDTLGLPQGMVPALRFAGEHAGRGVVAQQWLRGRPFKAATEPIADSPQLAAAAERLTALAAASVERRPAGDVGAAVRELFDRFQSIHHLTADEFAFLDEQVVALERWEGTLPVVCQHGDPGVWNLLVDDGGRVSFLDWEAGESHGLPLWDLVHFQCSFGAWAARNEGARRRLDAAVRHLAAPSPLHARFTAQISDLARVIDLPRPMIGPLFYTCWMHRALKEATRRTPATLDRGLYRRLVGELIRRRDARALRQLLAIEP